MKLVVDSNIIIACLIKGGKTAELLVNPALQLYAPEFIVEEISKYKDEILGKTHRNLESFSLILSDILSIITIVPHSSILKYIIEGERISPDEKDKSFFALALHLSCPIWSNDKMLKNQKEVLVYSTEEILKKIKTE